MALVYPLDILAEFPGWTVEFDLMYREEYSRQANGRTRSKDLGTPIWKLVARSRRLSPNQLDYWRARLSALEGGKQTFRGYSMSRCAPIAYPGANWPGGTAPAPLIHTKGADNKTLRLKGLAAGFKLSVGDYLSFEFGSPATRVVHRVMEPATASSSGITGNFEVRPHMRPGSSVDAAVLLVRPWVPMSIVPGTIETPAGDDGRGTVSFEAHEAI